MDTADFDYDLPASAIAQRPVEPRDAARLLVDLGPAHDARARVAVDHRHVRDLPNLLEPGDLVVVNTTRVLPARLHLVKATGGAAEVLLLEPRPDLGARPPVWEALVRPGRRLPPGTVLTHRAASDRLRVTVGRDLGDGVRAVALEADGDLVAAIEALGEMPLPPYIHEHLDQPERYQTVYSGDRPPRSVAAPTAGLHLTDAVLTGLGDRGIEVAEVELVVGLGTFRPIDADKVEHHRMHRERYRVPEATAGAWAATRSRGGQVVAVGTTAVRAVESAAATGDLEGSTELFIHGDFPFRVVDRLLTNFHLPRSSLLVMIDAFAGGRWRDLYGVAVADGYRFLSFGDAMLLTRQDRWDGAP